MNTKDYHVNLFLVTEGTCLKVHIAVLPLPFRKMKKAPG